MQYIARHWTVSTLPVWRFVVDIKSGGRLPPFTLLINSCYEVKIIFIKLNNNLIDYTRVPKVSGFLPHTQKVYLDWDLLISISLNSN